MPLEPVQFTFSHDAVVLARFSLDPGDYVIGRDETCQVVIDVDGMGPQHARLRVGEQVVLEDLESGSGTFLAGQPVTAPVALGAQQPVTFGTCPGELRLEPRNRTVEPKPLPKPEKPAKRRRRKERSRSAVPAFRELADPAPLQPDVTNGQGWEIWAPGSTPAEEKDARPVTERVQECRDRLNASEDVAASEMREILLTQEREIRELHAELARLSQEYSQLAQSDQQDAAERQRVKESASLLSIANRALVRKLSALIGPKDERMNLRRELREREKALVEAWERRQASDERCSQLSKQVARLEAGLGQLPAAPVLYLPNWLAGSFIAIALALGLLGYGLRTMFTRAQAAESIVSKLRSTAPQFYADAEALVAEGDFQHALTKIDCAVALDPSRAEYFSLKGNICESLLLVDPALASYWQAVALQPGDTASEKNLELCRSVRASRRGANSAESQYAFHEIMLRQGRLPEALQMAKRLGTDYELMQRTWSAILTAAGLHADLNLNDDGTLDLDLTAQSSVDLAVLRGMPLRKLTLARSNVVDLTPLHDSSVKELDLSGNPVQDLGPITGLALETLNLSNTGVSNLFPLAGLPLRELILDHAPVSDLSPLRGLHLQILRAAGTTVWNLQPLGESPIQILDLARTRVADLTPLRHLPLHELILDDTGVSDLQPLEGAPLRLLDLSRTPVRSVAPLRGAPLRELLLGGCSKLESIESLAQSTDLERLVLPPHCTHLSILRILPHLRFLSYDQQGNTPNAANLTARQFWASYTGK